MRWESETEEEIAFVSELTHEVYTHPKWAHTVSSRVSSRNELFAAILSEETHHFGHTHNGSLRLTREPLTHFCVYACGQWGVKKGLSLGMWAHDFLLQCNLASTSVRFCSALVFSTFLNLMRPLLNFFVSHKVLKLNFKIRIVNSCCRFWDF